MVKCYYKFHGPTSYDPTHEHELLNVMIIPLSQMSQMLHKLLNIYDKFHSLTPNGPTQKDKVVVKM